MFQKRERVSHFYSYDRLTTTMESHTEAVDVYSVLKPVFVVPKVLGLSPYSAVGDVGNRRAIVTLSAVIYSIGMLMLHVGVSAYRLIEMNTWENICSFGGNILIFGAICHAVSGYFTSLLGYKQIVREFTRLSDLIGKTHYSAWRRDSQLLLAMQIVCVIMIVTAGAMEISQVQSEFRDSHKVLVFMFHYVTEHSGFMSEHQFVAFIHVLKRIVQNWNNYIDALCENDDVINCPFYRNLMIGRKSVLFTVSNNSVTSKREKTHSKLTQFKQLRELHASACDIAESVNAVYSPMLLLSVAKSFTSLTQILYYILINVIVQERSFFCKVRANTTYFVWLIYCSLRLVWLVYFTAYTAKEVSHRV
jgi:hypothetical protein